MDTISVEWLLPNTSADLEDLKKSNLASIRLRAAVCMHTLKDNDCETTFGDAQHDSTASTLIVGKLDFTSDTGRPQRWLKHISTARKRGARIVIDYTDHHLETETAADHFYRMALIGADLEQVDGVCSVHDLHVWDISPGEPALIGHVEISNLADWPVILQTIKTMLLDKHGIDHITLQAEVAHDA